MSYASEQLYITWGGLTGSAGSSDIWQCGVHFAPIVGGGSVGNPNQDQADAVYSLLSAYHADADLGIAIASRLTFVKIAKLDTAGEYTMEPIIHEVDWSAGTQGGATVNGSPQLSLVVTLWSGGTLGQANYGRYYLPWNCLPVTTDGYISVSDAGEVSAKSAVLLDDMYDAIETNKTGGGILAATNMPKVGSGTNKRVTKVRVDTIKDTQRRRTNAMVSNPQVSDLGA